ncbi:MAG: 1-phosphofructokinase family hexose kinase [Alphaproteobacteria bacterium]|nr:1-phosphofructokinase family hexose kinase [Alphaproteobacteria bacterium]MBL7097748.1 1-phosphofructokinase family hexose kinase [Alphaproteobacteria bacterium]
MSPIVTLTLNPAVDVSSRAAQVVPGHKLRCHDVRHDAGGGGINVARVLRRFGTDTHAVFTCGGPTGNLLERLVRHEEVPCTVVQIAGDTREDFAVSSEDNGMQYRFVLPGPELSAFELDTCLSALARAASTAGYVVASGSLPPDAPIDSYRRVCAALPKGIPFALDTSGDALRHALGPGLTLIKPSRRELEQLTGTALPDRTALSQAARRLVEQRNTEMVAVTLGEDGALLVGRGFSLEATAPTIDPISTIGAGDSFLALLVLSLSEGRSPTAALRRATAAGSAALLSSGTALCHPAQVDELAARVEIRSL